MPRLWWYSLYSSVKIAWNVPSFERILIHGQTQYDLHAKFALICNSTKNNYNAYCCSHAIFISLNYILHFALEGNCWKKRKKKKRSIWLIAKCEPWCRILHKHYMVCSMRLMLSCEPAIGSRRGRHRMEVVFTTICVISAYHH